MSPRNLPKHLLGALREWVEPNRANRKDKRREFTDLWENREYLTALASIVTLNWSRILQLVSNVFREKAKGNANAEQLGTSLTIKGLGLLATVVDRKAGDWFIATAERAKDKIGEIVSTFKSEIQNASWETGLKTVKERGMRELARLIVPGGGFFSFLKRLWDAVVWLIDNKKTIIELFGELKDRFLELVDQRTPDSATVQKGVIELLKGLLTPLIDAVATLIVGAGLGNTIRNALKKLATTLTKPIKKVLEIIANIVVGILNKVLGAFGLPVGVAPLATPSKWGRGLHVFWAEPKGSSVVLKTTTSPRVEDLMVWIDRRLRMTSTPEKEKMCLRKTQTFASKEVIPQAEKVAALKDVKEKDDVKRVPTAIRELERRQRELADILDGCVTSTKCEKQQFLYVLLPLESFVSDGKVLERASGVTAYLVPGKIRGGSEFKRGSENPSWWVPFAEENKPRSTDDPSLWQRGHLLGNQLGGPGRTTWANMVPLRRQANNPVMERCESLIRAVVDDCKKCVRLRVTPTYTGNTFVPNSVAILARSDDGEWELSVRIRNAADEEKKAKCDASKRPC